MMRAFILAAALCGACAGSARAEAPLAPLAPFGGCWRGTFAHAENITDERCFTPMLGGRFVRDTHEVKGAPEPYAGETVYYLDVRAGRVAFTYYASDGGMSTGFADADGEGGLVFPPGQYVGPDGETLTMRSSWRRDGPDRFLSIAEIEVGGQWREHLRIVYSRAADLTPPPAR